MQEPFIDISVGGQEIPNGAPDELQVWAVTVLGRVVVRQGVVATCPEGTGWLHIPTPNKYGCNWLTQRLGYYDGLNKPDGMIFWLNCKVRS